ncbi:DUF1990 family protein [Nocardioides endophyticus]|uniref:DUF1990 family protein n=1 Tax=Nocardioides endophyticus TaxID=1353775 RepID=UPI003CD05D9A
MSLTSPSGPGSPTAPCRATPRPARSSSCCRGSATGRITFTLTAFSRPATKLARLGGPVARGLQSRVTDRYLRAAEAGVS